MFTLINQIFSGCGLMNNESIFSNNGNTIKGNMYQSVGDMIINEKYSAEEIVKIIEVIQYKVVESNISKKNKQEIEDQFEKVKSQIALKNPDKKSISESINEVNGILKKTKESSDNLKEIGKLIGKIAYWLKIFL